MVDKTPYQKDHEGLSAAELKEAQRQLAELAAERSGKSKDDAERRKIAAMSDHEFRQYKDSLGA